MGRGRGESLGMTKSLSRKVFVGCSVSTDPGCCAQFGAHRAPYETPTLPSETGSDKGLSGR